MRIGLHLLSQAANQFFGNPSAERTAQVAAMKAMGVTDVKLVTDSDSQVKACKWLSSQGFRVIVRFYLRATFPDGHPQAGQFDGACLAAVPDNQLSLFRDAGVYAVEGYINEPEIEWNLPPTPATIDMLAMAYIRFADACGRVGVTPITPAIQGDRVYNWFEPMIARIIGLGRKDTLEKCIIGVHPRPANNLPSAPPPGFVARSYELFEDVAIAYGIPTRMMATEWGYEPNSSENNTLPTISPIIHAEYNRRLAQMEHSPCLEACFYWTWLHDWFDSGWWRGSVEGSLPVVKAFIEMTHDPEPQEPEPQPGIPAAELTAAVNDRMALFPWGMKRAWAMGYLPFGDEVHVTVGGVVWFGQPARKADGSLVILAFRAGEYEAGKTVEIPFKL
jgi:hypothetical protein